LWSESIVLKNYAGDLKSPLQLIGKVAEIGTSFVFTNILLLRRSLWILFTPCLWALYRG
jgi:hypothetical protein